MSATTARCSFSHNTFPVIAELNKAISVSGEVSMTLRLFRRSDEIPAEMSGVTKPLPASSPIDFSPFKDPDAVKWAMEGIGGVVALRFISKLVNGLPNGTVAFHHLPSSDFIWFTPRAWDRLGMRAIKDAACASCVTPEGRRRMHSSILFPSVRFSDLDRLRTLKTAVEATGTARTFQELVRTIDVNFGSTTVDGTDLAAFLRLKREFESYRASATALDSLIQPDLLGSIPEFQAWKSDCQDALSECTRNVAENSKFFFDLKPVMLPGFPDEEYVMRKHYERCLELAADRGIAELVVSSEGRLYYASPPPRNSAFFENVVIGHKEGLKHFWTDEVLESEVERFSEARFKLGSVFSDQFTTLRHIPNAHMKHNDACIRGTLAEIDYVCACALLPPLKCLFRFKEIEELCSSRAFLGTSKIDDDLKDLNETAFVAWCDTDPDRSSSTMRLHLKQMNHAFEILRGKSLVFVENELKCTSAERAERERARLRDIAERGKCRVVLI